MRRRARRAQMQRMLDYMGLTPGQKLQDLKVDVVFIGSCTNSRIEDICAPPPPSRRAARSRGRARMVVPGSAW
jgi:3-isopropylmalate/(R)-2-methylmalate dehydratase large subunit